MEYRYLITMLEEAMKKERAQTGKKASPVAKNPKSGPVKLDSSDTDDNKS